MIRVVRADCFQQAPDRGSVDLIVTDPPYGKILGTAWDRDWSYDDQIRLLFLIEESLKPGGTAYVWGGVGTYQNRIFFQWLSELERVSSLRIWDVITWQKKRFYGVKNRYGFAREECAMLVKGDKPATFHVPYLAEKRGYAGFNADYPAKSEFKRRTNVWSDVSDMQRGKIHPAQKPVRLAEIMIETSSNPGETVVDFFAGSGSTGVAAANLDRHAVLYEISSCPMLF